MNPKEKYYHIFGLSTQASKEEIRRAYRKLAMKYHPDKNDDPKANQVFIDLAEAYAILMDDKILPLERENKRKDRSFEERKKEAEKRYKQQQAKELKEQQRYYKNLTSGRTWHAFTWGAYLSFFIGFILLIEPLLPSHFETHEITSFSTEYNGLLRNQVICIKTDKGITAFVVNPYRTMLSRFPTVQIERSFVFRNPYHIWYQSHTNSKSFDVDFSVINLFPLIPFLFFIPFITYRFKKRSYWFTLGYYSSSYLIFPGVIYFLFTQDRWIHLITFGAL